MRTTWQVLWLIPLAVGCIPRQLAGVDADAAPPARAVTAASGSSLGLKRGINLGNALDGPSEGAWGVVLSETHFEMPAAAGFDHVRLPVRFNAHALASAPYTIDAAFFARVDWALDQAQARGLSVILDLHHYEELMKEPAAHTARFVALWEQIAERYKDRPPSVIFEPLNEPNGALSPVLLNALYVKVIAAIRAKNPTRKIVIDGYSWASVDYLDELELPANDPDIIPSFHMYQPILFTHQGAPWMTPEYGTRGIVFPGPPPRPVTPVAAAQEVSWVRDWLNAYNTTPAAENRGGPKGVEIEFEKVSAYLRATGRTVYMGEFGVNDNADPDSRARYLRLVRASAERMGIGWAYWDDGGSFKAMDTKTGQWLPYLRDALLGP